MVVPIIVYPGGVKLYLNNVDVVMEGGDVMFGRLEKILKMEGVSLINRAILLVGFVLHPNKEMYQLGACGHMFYQSK